MLSIHNYSTEAPIYNPEIIDELAIELFDRNDIRTLMVVMHNNSAFFTPERRRHLIRHFGGERLVQLAAYIRNDLGVSATMAIEDFFVQYIQAEREISNIDAAEMLQMMRF